MWNDEVVTVPLDLLLPFLLASVLVTVIPGADMALVTRQVLVGGPGLAQRTILGNLGGLLVHGVALAAGLSALLVASAVAYSTVKLAGVVSTVLNPKPALFFLTFLPQFVDRDRAVLPQTLTLVAIHVVVGLIWLSAYAHLVHQARGMLTGPRVKAWLERATGAVLIVFGLRVAVERR